MKRARLGILLVVGTVWGAIGPQAAQEIVTVEKLASRAELIVVGELTDVRKGFAIEYLSYRDGLGADRWEYRIGRIVVDRVLKGELKEQEDRLGAINFAFVSRMTRKGFDVQPACGPLYRVFKEGNKGVWTLIAEPILGYAQCSGVWPVDSLAVFEKHLGNVPTGIAATDIPRLSATGNYPNPFAITTTIEYWLQSSSSVVLTIYNALGQRVTQIRRTLQPAGRQTIMWNGLDDAGRKAASGVYYYRLKAGGLSQTRTMVILR